MSSEGAFTVGYEYEVRPDGSILDDRNRPWRPELPKPKEGVRITELKNKWWEVTKATIDGLYAPNVIGTSIDVRWDYDPVTQEFKRATPTQPKEETKTMDIKKATLINGQDSDMVSTNEILDRIDKEGGRIKYLESLPIKSKAVDGLVKKHKANINALVEILDSREETD